MALQFKRKYRLQVDTLRFTELDISFSIEKSLRSTPNKASIKITNLSEESRNQLDELSLNRSRGTGRIRTVLEVGYQSDPLSAIFSGDLRNAKSEETPPGTWVTTLEGEDAGRAFLWSRVNTSFAPGATPLQVAMSCVEAMGIGVGNLREALANATFEQGGNNYEAGTVLSGSAPDELRGVLRSCGFTYSVQDNVLQVLRRGAAIQRTAVRLAWNTGLVGSPVKQLDGTIKLAALLNPDIYPSRQLQIESRTVNGTFKAEKVKYSGDVAALAWYCEIEARELVTVT
jgi:hypothetical protein